MSRTKIAGYLMIVISVLSVAVDALNGGGFSFNAHLDSILGALSGAGFVFARSAIDKVITAVSK